MLDDSESRNNSVEEHEDLNFDHYENYDYYSKGPSGFAPEKDDSEED